MKNIILTSLITSVITFNAVASTNDTIQVGDQWITVGAGLSKFKADGEHIGGYSFGADYTRVLMDISADNNIYLGLSAGLDHTDNKEDFFYIDNSDPDYTDQTDATSNLTTNNFYVVPKIFYSPINKVKLYAGVGGVFSFINVNSKGTYLDIDHTNGTTDIHKFDNSDSEHAIGMVAELGGTYMFNEHWGAGFKYRFTQIKYNLFDDSSSSKADNFILTGAYQF
ncbi:hypothetical protein E2R68_11915 [Psychromonas sp. RZ22]|uniref:outer membrane beta-barrel protein n=1 Tax=Psychromonas algarum TaxID=2555643 RepID=UPI00106843BE|nr:outer membrane beta-barrel protein [Psychromonas sp. RZ22]TEW53648.1 hypothetical protein E2R68_11915 [Psychromonas sp. RZ22]